MKRYGCCALYDALANTPRMLKNNFHGEQTMPRHEIVDSDGNMEPNFSELEEPVSFCETIM